MNYRAWGMCVTSNVLVMFSSFEIFDVISYEAVSYTHLTLPTNDKPCVDLGGGRSIKKKKKKKKKTNKNKQKNKKQKKKIKNK